MDTGGWPLIGATGVSSVAIVIARTKILKLGKSAEKEIAFHFYVGKRHRIKGPNEYEYYEDFVEKNLSCLIRQIREDIHLITFTSDGLPVPVEENEQSDNYERARASIKIYHLDSFSR